MRINLTTPADITNFIRIINADFNNKYILENVTGTRIVDANSYFGILYMSMEYGDNIYLVNISGNKVFPPNIIQYKV